MRWLSIRSYFINSEYGGIVLTEDQIRAVAQKVVNESKGTARKDTGALKRSIAYTYVRNVVTFRELIYGQYGDNSRLEKNAIRLMPYGVQWRIIYTTFGGGDKEVGRTRQGRATQSSTLGSLLRSTTSKIRNLIGINKAKNGKA
jgi:hypothetical protein